MRKLLNTETYEWAVVILVFITIVAGLSFVASQQRSIWQQQQIQAQQCQEGRYCE